MIDFFQSWLRFPVYSGAVSMITKLHEGQYADELMTAWPIPLVRAGRGTLRRLGLMTENVTWARHGYDKMKHTEKCIDMNSKHNGIHGTNFKQSLINQVYPYYIPTYKLPVCSLIWSGCSVRILHSHFLTGCERWTFDYCSSTDFW